MELLKFCCSQLDICFYSFALLRTLLSEGSKLFCIFRLYFFRFVVFSFVPVLTLSLSLMICSECFHSMLYLRSTHTAALSLSLTRLSIGFCSSLHSLLKTNNFFLFHLWFIIQGHVWSENRIPNQVLLMLCRIKSILCFLKINLVYLSKLIFGWKKTKSCISRLRSLCSLNAQMYEVFSGGAVVHDTIPIWHSCSYSVKFDKCNFAIFSECDKLWFWSWILCLCLLNNSWTHTTRAIKGSVLYLESYVIWRVVIFSMPQHFYQF